MASCGPAGDECRVCVTSPTLEEGQLTGALTASYLNGRAIFDNIKSTVDNSAVVLTFSLCYNQGEDTVLVGKDSSDPFVVRPNDGKLILEFLAKRVLFDFFSRNRTKVISLEQFPLYSCCFKNQNRPFLIGASETTLTAMIWCSTAISEEEWCFLKFSSVVALMTFLITMLPTATRSTTKKATRSELLVTKRVT